VSPASLSLRLPEGQPRVLALAGRAWVVTHVDWKRRCVYVAPFEGRGRSRWSGRGGGGLGLELAQSMRAVLLGEDPGIPLSRRGIAALERLRFERASTVNPEGTVLSVDDDVSRWSTYAGSAANTSLAAALDAGGFEPTTDSLGVTLAGRAAAAHVRAAAEEGLAQGALPKITDEALDGLKFSAALPRDVAAAVLAERITDAAGAATVAGAVVRVVMQG
jgi:ATP-dependent Lhr-like helicase